ncbi:MAG: hypothetical protein KDC14_08300 [Planctomycetes bacterium]|nr:hypothetical protein [Planctomycetota bacterium]
MPGPLGRVLLDRPEGLLQARIAGAVAQVALVVLAGLVQPVEVPQEREGRGDEAARLAGGCEGLSSLASVVSSLRFECDADAGDDGLCVTRSGIGFLCTTPESDAYVCAEGLECATFGTSDGDLRICTKDCRVDRDCNETGSFDNYCQPLVTGNVCLPRFGEGSRCADDRQCASGDCFRGVCR